MTTTGTAAPPDQILQFFEYSHLPAGEMQNCSREFFTLAHKVVEMLPRNPERTVALRKLLEAKGRRGTDSGGPSESLSTAKLHRHKAMYEATVAYGFAVSRNVPPGKERTECLKKMREAMAAANAGIMAGGDPDGSLN